MEPGDEDCIVLVLALRLLLGLALTLGFTLTLPDAPAAKVPLFAGKAALLPD